MTDEASLTDGFEQFRSYLRVLARTQIGPKLRSKIDADDIVQQTMLHAVKGQADFKGETQAERAGWLRKILARNIAHTVRDYGREKRDVSREFSMEQAIDASSVRLERWIVAEQSSPSQKFVRKENILRLASAVDRLPEAQRESIEMHYLQGMTLAEVSEQMGRTPAAVAGLLHRGLKALKVHLRDR